MLEKTDAGGFWCYKSRNFGAQFIDASSPGRYASYASQQGTPKEDNIERYTFTFNVDNCDTTSVAPGDGGTANTSTTETLNTTASTVVVTSVDRQP